MSTKPLDESDRMLAETVIDSLAECGIAVALTDEQKASVVKDIRYHIDMEHELHSYSHPSASDLIKNEVAAQVKRKEADFKFQLQLAERERRNMEDRLHDARARANRLEQALEEATR